MDAGDLPFWLKVLVALATPAIAVLGIAIAWGQWVTARSKLILDLFERRQSVYNAFLGPVGDAMRSGTADMETYVAFMKIVHQAKFLFGRDVQDYINQYGFVFNRMAEATSMLDAEFQITPEERQKALKSRADAMLKLGDFYSGLDKLMSAYMLMDQKHWFGRRWRQLRPKQRSA